MTVALAQNIIWKKDYGFLVDPIDGVSSKERVIIEVYPALEKMLPSSFEKMQRLIPSNIVKNSDAYDACICSLLAVAYGSEGAGGQLSSLQMTPDDFPEDARREGWIFHSSCF